MLAIYYTFCLSIYQDAKHKCDILERNTEIHKKTQITTVVQKTLPSNIVTITQIV